MLIKIVYATLALAWMLVIYFASSLSSPGPLPPVSGIDKLTHAIVFGILAYFYARSFCGHGRLTPLQAFFAIGLAVTYGILDELHQAYVPGRDASALDAIADALGAFIAVLGLRYVQARRIQSSDSALH